MRLCLIPAVLASLAIALSSPLPAHASIPEPPGDVPIVGDSIDVRVINVETVVTDKAGRRVHGLTASDLRLLVDGREVPVEFFNEVEDGRSTTTGEDGDPVGRNYLVYVDDSFSLATRRNAVLDKIEADLSLLSPGDRMAILAFAGNRIDILSNWTADPIALRAALALARSRPAFGNQALTSERALHRDEQWVKDMANSINSGDSVTGGGGGYGDEVAALLHWMSFRTPLEARTQLGRTSLAIGDVLGSFEAPTTGRRVAIYLTGAWSLGVDPDLFMPLVTIANQTGYTVYPVDTAKSDAELVTGLDDIAKATGGRALVSVRDEVFRQAVADSGSYYSLGFSPTWKGNGQGHRIEVKVLRPGLQARARSSFSDPSPRMQVALQASKILLFGGATEDRRLIVQIDDGASPGRQGRPGRRAAKTRQVPVTLGVPVESLVLNPQGKGFVAELPLAIKAVDAQRQMSDLPPLRLRVVLKERPRAGTYARFRAVLELRNVEQRLVFTVQDLLNGHSIWGEASIQPDHVASAKPAR